jgi:hypothetical protein
VLASVIAASFSLDIVSKIVDFVKYIGGAHRAAACGYLAAVEIPQPHSGERSNEESVIRNRFREEADFSLPSK